MLQLPPEWVYGSPGTLAPFAVSEFFDLITRIADQGESWSVLEIFKGEFGCGSHSSSESWALSDLRDALNASAENAPAFIAAFWRGRVKITERYPGHPVPDENVINSILIKHAVPFEVRPPHLLSRSDMSPPPVTVPEVSVGEAAKALIESSLLQADKFLLAHQPRQAVQEILWLLETVSTGFAGKEAGNGTVEGKYFNEIIRDLRRHNRGTILAQAGTWMTTLHGFLSSPSGGGVRHGTDLSSQNELQLHEAALYCNLTRSYIGYLLAELAQLNDKHSSCMA